MQVRVNLFDDIRGACRTVSERARWVHVDHTSLQAYARTLPIDRVRAPSLDPAHHFVGPPEATLAFVLAIDAINFGSGYFPHLQKRHGMSGYLTVATSLKEWFEQLGGVSPGDLAGLTPERCATILGQPVQPENEPVGELMTLYAAALRELARFVTERFGGRFAGLVEAAGHSAEKLVRLLHEMPFYRDVHRYDEFTVPFYKRAQITAADLSVALADHEWGRFQDTDRLTIFADNLVPHVLRMDGLLQYDPTLLGRINRGELLPSGAPEEIEIRACGLTAVEVLVAHLRAQGIHITARDLDYFLWNRGQLPHYKSQPRHRTRCVFY